MKFDRTEEGFAKAFATATSMANMHNRSYTVAVFADQPKHYTLSMASLVTKDSKLAPGTQAMTVNPGES